MAAADRGAPSIGGVKTSTDLLVVGSGILGLATAFRAHRQGRTVRVVDAAARPVGASIQNFGHACFTGQADVIQDVAASAREGWLDAARAAGFWAAESGTHIPAATETEARVLEEFAEHRGSDRSRCSLGSRWPGPWATRSCMRTPVPTCPATCA